MLPISPYSDEGSAQVAGNKQFLIIFLTPENCRSFIFTLQAEALIARDPHPELWLFPPAGGFGPSRPMSCDPFALWSRWPVPSPRVELSIEAMPKSACPRCSTFIHSVLLTSHLIYKCPMRLREIRPAWAGPPSGEPLEYWEKD